MNRPTSFRFAKFSFIATLCVAILLTQSMTGCAALAVSLAGAGAGAGISHQVNGVATRTFSEPLTKMDSALLVAAKRMTIQVDTVEATGSSHTLKGRVGDLDVTVEMEALSGTVTRVDVTARKNLFRVDSATAQEIVTQIERAVANPKVAEAKDSNLETTRNARRGKTKTKGPNEI
ncbi:DUF3568 family protein [Uliginosibacterium gangwonense]|uniref:DUF3568 family protein n=1 Tax=Uliginosibacterium gangwonense TaxID=392736 RepID=UPI000374910F|nr:DUF3568 family protein [Uliginosibacterium gangwonense]